MCFARERHADTSLRMHERADYRVVDALSSNQVRSCDFYGYVRKKHF